METKPLMLWMGGLVAVLIIGVAIYSLNKPGSSVQVVGSGDQHGTSTTQGTTGSTTGTGSTSTTGQTNPQVTPAEQYGINMSALLTKVANDIFLSEKIYLIDNSSILVLRTGNGADYSYSHLLLDKNLNQLCILSDSIAGPRETCTDSSKKAMFDTAVANMDKSYLGLSGHAVVMLYQTSKNPQ